MKDNKKSVSKKREPREKEKSRSENLNDAPPIDHLKKKDKNLEEEFPAYPHYSASDDIYNQDVKELELNEEGVTQAEQKTPQALNVPLEEKEEDEKSEADVTAEDLQILDDNLNADEGDDDQLRFRETPVHMTAEDLDVPGAELDDAEENIGEEDEENNPYSIGGDRHEDLEENRS
jgi:hypothetical protein